jgi:hypothetical protein
MTASELAFKAAQVMSERGHCKNQVHDDQGRVCFVGALGAAALQVSQQGHRYPSAEYYKVIAAAGNILRSREGLAELPEDVIGGSAFKAIRYNNREDVTGEDVILLFKQCGEYLERK